MKPKLTLRDLFWLVLVCAMALGWWRELRIGHDRKLQLENAHQQYQKMAIELRAQGYWLPVEPDFSKETGYFFPRRR